MSFADGSSLAARARARSATSRGYVRHIVDEVHQKVYLDAQPLQPGGGDPLALVCRAEEVIAKIERTREPYEEKYLLIDRDKIGSSPERDQQISRYSTASTHELFGRTLPMRRSSYGTCRAARCIGRRTPRSRCSDCGSSGHNTRSLCRQCSLRTASISRGCVRPRRWKTICAPSSCRSSCCSTAPLRERRYADIHGFSETLD